MILGLAGEAYPMRDILAGQLNSKGRRWPLFGQALGALRDDVVRAYVIRGYGF